MDEIWIQNFGNWTSAVSRSKQPVLKSRRVPSALSWMQHCRAKQLAHFFLCLTASSRNAKWWWNRCISWWSHCTKRLDEWSTPVIGFYLISPPADLFMHLCTPVARKRKQVEKVAPNPEWHFWAHFSSHPLGLVPPTPTALIPVTSERRGSGRESVLWFLCELWFRRTKRLG